MQVKSFFYTCGLVGLLAASACKTAQPTNSKTAKNLPQLREASYQKDLMGHFNSCFEGIFKGIRAGQPLFFAFTRIWKNQGGVWFYNTSFTGDLPEEPMEQRILSIRSKTVDTLVLSYYKLNPAVVKGYVQGWRNAKMFDNLTIKDLVMEDSCEMSITRADSVLEFRQRNLCPMFGSELTGFAFYNTKINLDPKGFHIAISFFDKLKTVLRKTELPGNRYTRLLTEEELKPVLAKLDAAGVRK